MTLLRLMSDVPESQRLPMSPALSEIFIACSINDIAAEDTRAVDTIPVLPDMGAGLAVMSRRIAGHAPDLPVRKATLMLLACLCETPADAVMWAFYIVHRTRELGRGISIELLALDFPMGFPSRNAMQELWDEQKGAARMGGNFLDENAPWSSRAPR